MMLARRGGPVPQDRPSVSTGTSSAVRAFAIGLPLAPLGGLVGALLLAIPMVWTVGSDLSLSSLLSYVLLFGITFGALLAAPTTLVVLPAACLFFGRHVPRLAAVGFASGAATMLLIVVLTWQAQETIHWGRALGVLAVGGMAGAVCGVLQAAVLRHRIGEGGAAAGDETGDQDCRHQ